MKYNLVGEWTRVVLELKIMTPQVFPGRYFYLRAFIGITIEEVAFKNTEAVYQNVIFGSPASPTIVFCARYEPGTDNIVGWGHLELMDFIWVKGIETLLYGYMLQNTASKHSFA